MLQLCDINKASHDDLPSIFFNGGTFQKIENLLEEINLNYFL
jgi:hypothetical protein